MSAAMWFVVLLGIVVMCTTDVSEAGKFRKLDVMTFNTALWSSPHREARLAKLIEALAASATDFVCLQEVWFGEDVEAIVNGLRHIYPYSYSKIHYENGCVDGAPDPEDGPVCNVNLVVELLNCVQTACAATDFSDRGAIFNCSVANCAKVMKNFYRGSTDECLSCFGLSFPDVTSIFTACAGVSGPSRMKKMNSLGLLMLSKKRLTRENTYEFFPNDGELTARGALKARVAKRVIAVCTSLSPIENVYSEVNLLRRFCSYEQQQAYEIGQLVTKFSRKNKLILLGNFNAGPKTPGGLSPIRENHYNILKSAFKTVLVDCCTFCSTSENLHNTGDKSYAIDHIFARRLRISHVRVGLVTIATVYSIAAWVKGK